MNKEEINEFLINLDDEGKRLDSFLAEELKISRSDLQKHILAGKVLVNNRAVKSSYKLKNLDIIQAENILPKIERPLTLSSEVKLDILFEDEDIIVINKQSGIQVHPDAHNQENTLVQAVAFHYPEIVTAIYDPNSEVSKLRPGVVHRLDKDTSGVIVFAKNVTALHNLAEQFHNRTIHKKYLTLLYGELKEEKRVETYIRRKSFNQNMMGVTLDPELGKLAISNFSPIKTFKIQKEVITLAECQIETGRTHQIRVHAKYISLPVLGDPIYWSKSSHKLSQKLNIQRQLLHAKELEFTHPRTGEKVRFTAPEPEDFLQILTKSV